MLQKHEQSTQVLNNFVLSEQSEENILLKGKLIKRLRELASKNNRDLREYIIDILAEHCEDQDDIEAAEAAIIASKGQPTYSHEEIRRLHGLGH
jgi:hypothetical protein